MEEGPQRVSPPVTEPGLLQKNCPIATSQTWSSKPRGRVRNTPNTLQAWRGKLASLRSNGSANKRHARVA
eukprot:889318-Alexandrium_andersonii.AAC.1